MELQINELILSAHQAGFEYDAPSWLKRTEKQTEPYNWAPLASGYSQTSWKNKSLSVGVSLQQTLFDPITLHQDTRSAIDNPVWQTLLFDVFDDSIILCTRLQPYSRDRQQFGLVKNGQGHLSPASTMCWSSSLIIGLPWAGWWYWWMSPSEMAGRR